MKTMMTKKTYKMSGPFKSLESSYTREVSNLADLRTYLLSEGFQETSKGMFERSKDNKYSVVYV